MLALIVWNVSNFLNFIFWIGCKMGLDENDLLLVDLVANPGLPEGENCYFQQYDGEYISSNVRKFQIHLDLYINTFLL